MVLFDFLSKNSVILKKTVKLPLFELIKLTL